VSKNEQKCQLIEDKQRAIAREKASCTYLKKTFELLQEKNMRNRKRKCGLWQEKCNYEKVRI
jgi:hypothetical protein